MSEEEGPAFSLFPSVTAGGGGAVGGRAVKLDFFWFSEIKESVAPGIPPPRTPCAAEEEASADFLPAASTALAEYEVRKEFKFP